jgi:universal stress protein A
MKRRPAVRRSTSRKPRVRRRPAAAAKPVPVRAPAAREIASILVPIDFSVHSKVALSYAILIAQRFGASLHLIYVVEPTIYPADLGFGQVVLPGVEDELREKGAEELEGLIEREIGRRVRATSVVRTGNPHQEILREAEEKQADLIIVATHGHTGVEHMLFGSTADRVVRHATCPVLTVRAVK